MPGPNEFEPLTRGAIDRKYDELMAELDRHQRALALPEYGQDLENEARDLLNVSRARIRGMSAEECEEAAILLQQLAFHLQRRQNRCDSTVLWCEESIRWVIAREVVVGRGYLFEERKALAIRQNAVASRLQALKVQAEVLARDIAYLSVRIENQARRFSDMAKIKGKQHG